MTGLRAGLPAVVLLLALTGGVCPASGRFDHVSAPSHCQTVRSLDQRASNVTTPPPLVKYHDLFELEPVSAPEQALLDRLKLTLFPDPQAFGPDKLGADFKLWKAEVDLFFNLHGNEPQIRKLAHQFIVYYSAHPPGGRFPGALHDGAHPVKDWKEFFHVPLADTERGLAGVPPETAKDPLAKHIWYNLRQVLDFESVLAENGNYLVKKDADRKVGDRPYTQKDAAIETEVFLRRMHLRFKLFDLARREALSSN